MIAQRSICTPVLQTGFVRAIETAFEAGDVPEMQLVFLSDRVRFNQNNPKICGCVFDWQVDGQMGCRVEDAEQANRLRKRLEMPSLQHALLEHRAGVGKEGGKMPGRYEEHRARVAGNRLRGCAKVRIMNLA